MTGSSKQLGGRQIRRSIGRDKYSAKYLTNIWQITKILWQITMLFNRLPWNMFPACPLNWNRILLHRSSYGSLSYLWFLSQDWKYSDSNLWLPGNSSCCCSIWALTWSIMHIVAGILKMCWLGEKKFLWRRSCNIFIVRLYLHYLWMCNQPMVKRPQLINGGTEI